MGTQIITRERGNLEIFVCGKLCGSSRWQTQKTSSDGDTLSVHVATRVIVILPVQSSCDQNRTDALGTVAGKETKYSRSARVDLFNKN